VGIRARYQFWRVRRHRRRQARQVQLDLYRIAQDYKTFPRLSSLRKGAWALTAPGYRPVIADTPQDAVRRFLQRNLPKPRS
jgi:hypothetical protein